MVVTDERMGWLFGGNYLYCGENMFEYASGDQIVFLNVVGARSRSLYFYSTSLLQFLYCLVGWA